MEDIKKDKNYRVLQLYAKLMEGYVVNKTAEACNYGVTERSIQRDIDDIRDFLEFDSERTGVINSIVYDRKEKGYKLERLYNLKLSNCEILAICKILLDSRAFTKKEMTGMIERLIGCCVPESNREVISNLIKNEEFNYIELTHKSVFIDKMWDLGLAVHNCKYIEIKYRRGKDGEVVKRKIKPVAIMFSEFYFYMAAFMDDNIIFNHPNAAQSSYPTIYRIDRIQSYKILNEQFIIPYADRFEEGEFRKRIQFMYGGKLQKVKFDFIGTSPEVVLDRLPTAVVINEKDGVYTISAEVYGEGINMWLNSQGDRIKNIEIKKLD